MIESAIGLFTSLASAIAGEAIKVVVGIAKSIVTLLKGRRGAATRHRGEWEEAIK